jgi:hypothetical protein
MGSAPASYNIMPPVKNRSLNQIFSRKLKGLEFWRVARKHGPPESAECWFLLACIQAWRCVGADTAANTLLAKSAMLVLVWLWISLAKTVSSLLLLIGPHIFVVAFKKTMLDCSKSKKSKASLVELVPTREVDNVRIYLSKWYVHLF